MIAEIHQHQHPILSLSLVNEVFEYIHSDFTNIIYRDGNVLFDNDNNNDNDNAEGRLPISVILNSGHENMVVTGTGEHAEKHLKIVT